MVPPPRFSFLAMGRVTGELRTSTGDAAVDKARSRVINKDAKWNMIDEFEDNTRFYDPLFMPVDINTLGTVC
jgi:hypothetical protein